MPGGKAKGDGEGRKALECLGEKAEMNGQHWKLRRGFSLLRKKSI